MIGSVLVDLPPRCRLAAYNMFTVLANRWFCRVHARYLGPPCIDAENADPSVNCPTSMSTKRGVNVPVSHHNSRMSRL